MGSGEMTGPIRLHEYSMLVYAKRRRHARHLLCAGALFDANFGRNVTISHRR